MHPFDNAFKCHLAQVTLTDKGYVLTAPCRCPAYFRLIHQPDGQPPQIVEGCSVLHNAWLAGETVHAARHAMAEHVALRRDVQEGLGEIRNATAQGFAQVAAFFQAGFGSLPAGPPALPKPQD